MTKNKKIGLLKHSFYVGLHLAIVGIPVGIITLITTGVLSLMFGLGAGYFSNPIGLLFGFGVLSFVPWLVGILSSGYFLIKHQKWVFSNKLI